MDAQSKLSIHPYAKLFPELQKAELKELANDIKTNGLLDPIVLFEGQILDGRNRYKAALLAKLDLDPSDLSQFDAYTGKDPLGFVISQNLRRRHLSTSQRAMIAASIANLQQGRPSEKQADLPVKQEDAAKSLNVSERSVKKAKRIKEKGTKALQDAVTEGNIAVDTAADVAELSKAEQKDVLKQVKKAPDKSRAARTVIKQKKRAAKEKALGKKQKALPKGSFGVIYADPPWQFKVRSDKGKDRAAENHYPTAEFNKLSRLKIPAAKDCVCFMWATVPHLSTALSLLRAWGFEYKSHLIWAKPKAGTGYWFRNQHELLLVGIKGKIPAPAPGKQFYSIVKYKSGAHSAKPLALRDMIEAYFPNLPRIELFARGTAPKGWQFWGQEAKP